MGDSLKTIGNKNKKKYFQRNVRKRHFLEPGLTGFFCTCNFREKDCVRESYNILNEYADKLYGPTNQNSTETDAEHKETDEDKDDIDITDQLNKELNDIKNESKQKVKDKRFQAVDTGASNCIFIRTNLDNPQEIVSAILTDLVTTKIAKTRFLLRLLPILKTCKANTAEIVDCAGSIFDTYFLKEPSTFAIIFNRRLNNNVSKDDTIKELAELITLKNSGNKANLKKPKLAVIVEVIKGICLIGVVENYYEYKKYNLFEMCKEDETQDKSEKEVLVEQQV